MKKRTISGTVIPDSVTAIGEIAFHNNHIRNVIIPENVNEVGKYAFLNKDLEKVFILNEWYQFAGWYKDEKFY